MIAECCERMRTSLCLLTLVRLLTLIRGGEARGFYPAPFLLWTLFTWLLLRALLERGCSLRGFLAACAALFACGCALVPLASDLLFPGGWILGAAAAAAVLLPYVLHTEGAEAEYRTLAGMEIAVLLALFAVWLFPALGCPLFEAAPALAAALLGLLALYLERGGAGEETVRGSDRGGSMLTVLLPALLALGVLLLALRETALLGALARAAARLARSGVMLMGSGLAFLIETLASLLPAPEGGGEIPAPEPPPAFDAAAAAAEEPNPLLGLVLLLFVILLAAALVAFLIWKLRDLRLRRLRGGRIGTLTRTPPPRGVLIRSARDRLRLLRALIAKRNSPEVVYWHLRRRLQRSVPQKAGEPPCAYVRRLAAAAQTHGDQAASQALGSLAGALEQSLYAKAPPENWRPDRKALRRMKTLKSEQA